MLHLLSALHVLHRDCSLNWGLEGMSKANEDMADHRLHSLRHLVVLFPVLHHKPLDKENRVGKGDRRGSLGRVDEEVNEARRARSTQNRPELIS